MTCYWRRDAGGGPAARHAPSAAARRPSRRRPLPPNVRSPTSLGPRGWAGGTLLSSTVAEGRVRRILCLLDVDGDGSLNVVCAVIRIAATEHPRGEFRQPEDKRGGRALVLWSENPAEEPFRSQQSDHPIVCEGCISECQNWNMRENCRPTIFLKKSFSAVDSRVHPPQKNAPKPEKNYRTLYLARGL